MRDPLPVLSAFLADNPEIAPILNKVAHRYFQKGSLKGRQKLAADARTYGLLCDLFGHQAIHRDKHDRLTLNYDRFFQQVDASAWIEALHRVLGRDLLTASNQSRSQEQQVDRLLRSWRTLAPGRDVIHHWLSQQKPTLARYLENETQSDLLAEWGTVLSIFDFLHSRPERIALADLSARFTGSSKSLRSGRLLPLVATWLAISDGKPIPTRTRERHQFLADYGLVLNLNSIKVSLAGPIEYQVGELTFRWLHQFWILGQAGTLSWDNLESIDRLVLSDPQVRIITCENETPFMELVREGRDLCIYTEGFPNGAVLCLLRHLAATGKTALHWGDSDLNGLRIAAMIGEVIPTKLWRCDLAELKRHRASLIPLDETAARRTTVFLEKNPDFPFATELRFTLEQGWLEQESWTTPG